MAGAEFGLRRDAEGILSLARLEDGVRVGVLVTEPTVGRTDDPRSTISVRRWSPRTGPTSASTAHLDLAIHRCRAPGRDVPGRPGADRRRRRARPLSGRWSGPQRRCPGRGEPGLEAGAGRARDGGGSLSTPITPSATRWLRVCCAIRWPRSHSSAPRSNRRVARVRRRDPGPGRAAPRSPRGCPAWTSTTTSGRATHCSGAGCPISTWSPRMARCASSSCSTPRGRCC